VKLLRHVGDNGRPFASQVLAPGGQLEPNGTIFGPNQYFSQLLEDTSHFFSKKLRSSRTATASKGRCLASSIAHI